MRRALVALALALAASACGAEGAPPRQPLATWIDEAERDTPRWRAAIAWCERRPDYARCQAVLRAQGEVTLRRLMTPPRPAPDYDSAEHLPVVPAGIAAEGISPESSEEPKP
jgi:hypothetical protein